MSNSNHVAITYKYRIKGARAARLLRKYAWSANQVWNFCVQTQRKTQRNYRDGLSGKWLTHFDLSKLTASTSRDLRIHAQSIQGVCEQFVRSRDQHKTTLKFRKSGGSRKSLGWIPFQKQSRKITEDSVTYLGYTYRFFGAKRRPLPITAKGGAFVEDSLGRWWVTFHVEVDKDLRCGVGDVGIDLGLKTLAVSSDGEEFVAPRFYRQSEEQLAVAQRAGNLQRVKKINAKIAAQRADYLHKLSAKLIAKYAIIYVGNVSSSKLAKTKLAKSIHDAGWSTLRTMLRYKASRHGATFVEVDEYGSTRVCSACGILPSSSPKGMADLGIREWRCSACGAHHDRDVNAACNILAFGRSVTPLAEERRVAHGR